MKATESSDSSEDLAALRGRVEALEIENRALAEGNQAPRGDRAGRRWRAALSAALIVTGVALAPLAVLGSWARAELVDTDRFVATFAPLADDPHVQSYVSSQAMALIEQNVDIDGLVGQVFDGVSELGVSPQASAALGLLEAPASSGVRSLLSQGVDQVVTAPQFSTAWSAALRATHAGAVAVLQNQPGTALTLSSDGALAIDLGAVNSHVRSALQHRGLGLASAIPDINRSVPLVASDSLTQARSIYLITVAVGYWLPWIALACVGLGIALARRRVRAVAVTAGWLAAAFLLLAGVLGIGRSVAIAALSPATMPAETVAAMYQQLTGSLRPVIAGLTIAALMMMIGSWLAGSSHTAAGLRRFGGSATNRVRRGLDRAGLNTGAFGRGVNRWRGVIRWASAIAATLIVFLARPVTVAGVIWALAGMLLVLVALELLRRTDVQDQPAEQSETAEPTEPAESSETAEPSQPVEQAGAAESS